MEPEIGETTKQDDGRLALAVGLSVAVALPLWRAVLPGTRYYFLDHLQRWAGYDFSIRIPLYGMLIVVGAALGFLALLGARRIAAGQGAALPSPCLLGLAALLILFQYGSPALRWLAALAALPTAVVAWGGLANRAAGTAAGRERFITGWFAGLLLDLLLRFAGGTFDLAWQANGGARLFMGALALVAAVAALLAWPARGGAAMGALLPGTTWVALPAAACLALAGSQDVGALAVALPRSLLAAALLSAGYLVIGWSVAQGLPGRPGAAEIGTALLVILLAAAGSAWETFLLASLGAIASGLALAAVLSDPVEPALRRRVYGGGTAFFGMVAAWIALHLGGVWQDTLTPPHCSPDGLWAGLVLLGTCRMTRMGAAEAPATERWAYPGLLGGLLVALSVFAPPAREGSERPVGDSFRVLTLNLRRGVNRDGAFTLERVAALIEREKVDVVGLQGVARARKSEAGTDELGWLAEQLHMDSAFAASEGRNLGLGLLSRARILRPQVHYFGAGGGRSGALLVAGIQSYPALTAIVTELSPFSDVRRLQAAQLATATLPGDSLLIADLGADPPSPSVRDLIAPGRWTDAFRPGPQGGLTFPAFFPTSRRDAILFRGALTAGEGSVVNEIPAVSTHRAVVVRFHRQ